MQQSLSVTAVNHFHAPVHFARVNMLFAHPERLEVQTGHD